MIRKFGTAVLLSFSIFFIVISSEIPSISIKSLFVEVTSCVFRYAENSDSGV